MMTRRSLLLTAAGSLTLAAKPSHLKIGVTDWNLKLAGKPEALTLAKSCGFAGVEVSLGRRVVDNKLPMDNPELQATYLAESARLGMGLAGTCLDVLHVNYLKSDKLGIKWVADGIPITQKLKAGVMLLPFFGNGALSTRQEMDYVADALKEVAPQAEKAGVTLALEDTISAEDNIRIVERCGSKALKVYYDIGNSTLAGFDILKEIEWLGPKRIAQFHLKDNPHYLGAGKIDVSAAVKVIMNLGFSGWANLETSTPSNSVEADMKKNLGYVQNLVRGTKV